MWMKTIQQHLSSNNLSLNEATIVAQESSTLETDVYIWHYAPLVVLVSGICPSMVDANELPNQTCKSVDSQPVKSEDRSTTNHTEITSVLVAWDGTINHLQQFISS